MKNTIFPNLLIEVNTEYNENIKEVFNLLMKRGVKRASDAYELTIGGNALWQLDRDLGVIRGGSHIAVKKQSDNGEFYGSRLAIINFDPYA